MSQRHLRMLFTMLVGGILVRSMTGVSGADAQTATVTGTVSYRERIALPAGAVISVQLSDVSRSDAPATVLVEQSITTTGNQVPISFELSYDPAQIKSSNTYAVRATINADGQLLFTTTQQYAVITQGNPTHVDLVLQRVPATNGGTPSTLPNTGRVPMLFLLYILCGATILLTGWALVRRAVSST